MAKESCDMHHMKYPKSLILVWRIAAVEARNLNAISIEPMHLLIGLCKVVDVDLLEFVSKNSRDRDEVLEELLRETRRLRNVLHAAGLDAEACRRHLRRASPFRRLAQKDSERMHRSSDAKKVFADAEGLAKLGRGVVYPVHLLYATLLAKDAHRDLVFAKLKVDTKRLLTFAKREVLKPPTSSASSSKRRKARLN